MKDCFRMKKIIIKGKLVILTAALCLGLTAGCGKSENRYTYRDAGIEALNAEDYKKAIDSFDEAIKASQPLVGAFDIDVLKYRAEAEYRAEDYQAAVNTYGILIQVDKERPEYLNMRCISKTQAGDFSGALDDYKKAVRLDTQKNAPGRSEALLAAGAALENQGAASEAMAMYESAQADGMETGELYNRMGLCKMGEKDYDTAVTYFSRGLSEPDAKAVPELLYNQAVAYEYKGDFAKARELMEQYAADHETDEEAVRELEFLKSR